MAKFGRISQRATGIHVIVLVAKNDGGCKSGVTTPAARMVCQVIVPQLRCRGLIKQITGELTVYIMQCSLAGVDDGIVNLVPDSRILILVQGLRQSKDQLSKRHVHRLTTLPA
jgi:hypothetical protein